MKRLLSILLALIIPIFANADKPDIWERASYGGVRGVAKVELLGMNGGIPATFETMWAESAQYTPGVAALSAPYCASSDANDTSAGTGLRTMTVGGLNTSFARWSETVTMNGTSSVVLATTNILLIDTMEAITAGSGGLNAGVVQCGTGANTAGDPAVTHSYMAISSLSVVTGSGNKSTSFIYGVPDDKTLVCRNFSAGSVFATQASGIEFVVDGYTNLGIMKRFVWEKGAQAGAPVNHRGLVKFPEKTIIIGRMAGPTGSNTGPATLSAECLLIDSGSTDPVSQTEF